MSFRASANKVRNTELPIWKRLCALRSCIVPLSNLKGEGYRAMVQRYDTLYGFNRYRPRTDPPTEAQLLATLEALENERNVLIGQRRDEAQRNREAKLARKNVQRQSAPSYLWGMPCATREQFERTIAKSKPTLVFFGAPWDANSTRMAIWLPGWKLTAPSWRLLLLNTDREANFELYRELGFQNTPTALVFQRGQELARRVGFREIAQLRSWLGSTDAEVPRAGE